MTNKIKNDYGKKTLAETTRELYPVDKEVLNEAVMEIFVFLIALLGGLAYFSLESLAMKNHGVRAVFKKINIDLEDRKLTLNQIVKYIKKHGNKEDVQKIKEITKRIRKNTTREFWVVASTYRTRVRPEDVADILKIYGDIKNKEKSKKELILESRPFKESKILGRHIGKVTDKDIDIAKFKTKIAEARRDFQHAKKITAGKEINKKTAHDKAVDKRNNYLTGILMKQDYQRQVNSAKDILNKNKVKKEGN